MRGVVLHTPEPVLAFVTVHDTEAMDGAFGVDDAVQHTVVPDP
jgi:hypothetical protein